MDPVQELEMVFARIKALPDDEQFIAWNQVMAWLQNSMSNVASQRRLALYRYRRDGKLTRPQLSEKFNLTASTVSRLMDEVSHYNPSEAA